MKAIADNRNIVILSQRADARIHDDKPCFESRRPEELGSWADVDPGAGPSDAAWATAAQAVVHHEGHASPLSLRFVGPQWGT